MLSCVEGSGSSSRASTGRMIVSSAPKPPAWPVLSVVLIVTTVSHFASARPAKAASGLAPQRLPPRQKASRIFPASAASRHSRVS